MHADASLAWAWLVGLSSDILLGAVDWTDSSGKGVVRWRASLSVNRKREVAACKKHASKMPEIFQHGRKWERGGGCFHHGARAR